MCLRLHTLLWVEKWDSVDETVTTDVLAYWLQPRLKTWVVRKRIGPKSIFLVPIIVSSVVVHHRLILDRHQWHVESSMSTTVCSTEIH